MKKVQKKIVLLENRILKKIKAKNKKIKENKSTSHKMKVLMKKVQIKIVPFLNKIKRLEKIKN